MESHWAEKDLVGLETAGSYEELVRIAFEVIDRIPKPVVQVCGPISTGGRGSIEANMAAFGEAIEALRKEGKNVFDQRPFEDPIVRLEEHEQAKRLGISISYLGA